MMGTAALWGFLAGCRPAPVSLGPFPAPAPGHPGGLRYYLAKDLAVVEAEVTEFVETRIASDDGGILTERTETGRTASGIKISLQTTADPKFVYILNPIPRGLKDQALAVRVGDNGLLTSVDLESKNRSGEILLQIARIAGQAAVAAAGFRGPDGFDIARIAGLLPGPDSANPASNERTRRARRLEALSLEALYFLQESSAGREAWAEVDRLEDELVKRRETLRDQTDSAAEAGEAAGFTLAEKRAEFFEGSIEYLESRAVQARSNFESALGAFTTGKGLGREIRKQPIRRYLEIADLPPSAVLEGADGEDRIVKALEKDFPRALSLYREAGIVVTFDPAVSFAPRAEAALEKEDRARRKKDEIRVFYREPVPGFLRVFAWAEAVRRDEKCFTPAFGPIEEKWIFAVHPGWPVRSIACGRRAFASQNLELAINGQGRVVGLSRSATSSWAAVSTGLADSLTAVRGEIAATLKELDAIVQAWRGLSREKLEAQIDLLKLQMEKIKQSLESEVDRSPRLP